MKVEQDRDVGDWNNCVITIKEEDPETDFFTGLNSHCHCPLQQVGRKTKRPV